ncbi:MAG: methyltransferase domain-containing protein [Magnetospirillum sp.]|nr:methyltransferase domain-containing protein [Magnetospirillum sp.]
MTALSRDEMFEQALGLFRVGKIEDSVGLLRRLCDADPNDQPVLRALATFHSNVGDLKGAIPYYLRDLRCGITLETVRSLGAAYINLGDTSALEALAEEMHDLIWDDEVILQVWGFNLWDRKLAAKSIPFLKRAAQLAPDTPLFHYNLSAALISAERPEEAVQAYARHVTPWTGACTQKDVIGEYKTVSQGYDDNGLHHSFTERLLRCYGDAVPARRLRSVLELGCGTGLLATKMPASATSIWGIDISPDMLDAARARGIYDRLLEGDLVTVMEGISESFDTVFSACVLYHIADLRPVFTNVARLLKPEGVFAFSVDPMTDEQDIAVTLKGEFCHSRAYLRRLAAEVGLSERLIEIQMHRAPPGFFCVFKKL